MSPLKVVFFGTAEFALPTLQLLVDQPERFDVVAVVTQPDKPAGRTRELASSPVAIWCRQRGLSPLQPPKVKDATFIERVAVLTPDLFVVAAYGKILPANLLAIPKFGPLNLHGSILPAYRGASPIQAAIAVGDETTGVSLMVMDAEMDHGPIVATSELAIKPDDTHASLERRLGAAAAALFSRTVDDYVTGRRAARAQDHSRATNTKIIAKEDGAVDWRRDEAVVIERKIRAFEPWPGVFMTWNRNGQPLRIRLLKAAVRPDGPEPPGAVSLSSAGYPAVQSAAKKLEILELQLAGKKPTDGRSFLNGYPDLIGQVLA